VTSGSLGPARPMDTNTLRENLPANAREALEPSPRGAQLRRRAVAFAGFGLLVLGFLYAVGLGRLVVFFLLAAAAGAIALVVKASIGRRKRRVARGEQTARSAKSADNVLKGVGVAARRPLEGIRKRREVAGERASAKRQLEQAGRLNGRGIELRRQGDPAAAAEAHRAALGIVRSVGDRGTEAMTLNNLGLALGHAGDEQAAIDQFDEAATILREIDDEHHEGQVLANLGLLHGRSGRHEQAVYCLEEALGKLNRDSRAFQHVEEQLRRAS